MGFVLISGPNHGTISTDYQPSQRGRSDTHMHDVDPIQSTHVPPTLTVTHTHTHIYHTSTTYLPPTLTHIDPGLVCLVWQGMWFVGDEGPPRGVLQHDGADLADAEG